MPVSIDDITAENGTPALTGAEMLFVAATILVFESTARPADSNELASALTQLDTDGRQSLRAHITLYQGGQATIDGGSKALDYQPKLERWAIRNGVRSLLTSTGRVSLPQEPFPNTADSLQLFSIPLGRACRGSEF